MSFDINLINLNPEISGLETLKSYTDIHIHIHEIKTCRVIHCASKWVNNLCVTARVQYDLHFMKKIAHGSEAANLLIGTLRELEKPLVAWVRFTRAEQLADFTEIPVPTRFLFVYLGAVPGGGPPAATPVAPSSSGLVTGGPGGPAVLPAPAGVAAATVAAAGGPASAGAGTALGNGTKGAPLMKLEVVPPPDAAPAVTDAALQQAQARARELGRCMGALMADEVRTCNQIK